MLSTCNRTEVYAVAERFHGAYADIRDFLSELAFLPPEEFADHLYVHYDDDAVAPPVRGGRRARLGGRRRDRDPRPGPRAHGSWPTTRAPPGRRSTCCSATRSRSASGPAPRPASAAASPRSRTAAVAHGRRPARRARRPRGRWCSAPARWARAWPSPLAARRRRPTSASPTARRSGPRRWPTRVGGRAVAPRRLPSRPRRRRRAAHLHRGAVDACSSTATRAGDRRPRAGRPLLIVDIAVPRDVDPAAADAARRHAARHGRPAGASPRPACAERQREVAAVQAHRRRRGRALRRASARPARSRRSSPRCASGPSRSALAELERFAARLGGLDDRRARGGRGAHPGHRRQAAARARPCG